MDTDRELLDRYVALGDEAAFGEIVARQLNLVYSAALRQTSTRAAAADVAQQVFSNLARKAGQVPHDVALAAWLHRATRFAAAQQRRTEQRRQLREQEAHTMQQRDHEHPEPVWDEARGLLDESLDELLTEDRTALLLRFFEQHDFADVGAALGTTAEAARKRVDRALDRLRESLARRGVTTTAAALGGALTAHAVQVAPAGLVVTLTQSALAAGATAVAGTGWLFQLPLLASMKAKTILAGAVLSVALLVPLVRQENALANARVEQQDLTRAQSAVGMPAAASASTRGAPTDNDRNDLSRLREEYAALRARLAGLNRQAAEAQPASGKEAAPALATITLANARDAGEATPAALLETQAWAMLHGETNRLAQLAVAPPGMNPDLFNDQLVELKKESAQGPEHLLATTPIREIRILEMLPAAEPTDRWMVSEFVTEQGGSRNGVRNRTLVRQTDAGWRLVLGLDGSPVSQEPQPDSQP